MATTAMRNPPEMSSGVSQSQASGDPRAATSTPRSTGDMSIMSHAEYSISEQGTEQGSIKSTKSKSRSTTKARPRQGSQDQSVSARSRNSSKSYTAANAGPGEPPSFTKQSIPPRDLPLSSHPPESGAATSENEAPEQVSKTPSVPSVPSPSNRSKEMRSSLSSQQRDWASDRSPLQKLEVALTGISKEEKRARVQEAEMKLRERLARQKFEKEQAEAAAAATAAAAAMAAASAPRPSSKQSSHSDHRQPAGASRDKGRKDGLEGSFRNGPPNARPVQGNVARHQRTVSMGPQYPEIHHPEEFKHMRAVPAGPQVARMGTVSRKPVSMSDPAPKPGPGARMQHARAVSQSGPPGPPGPPARQQAFVPPVVAPVAAPAVAAAVATEDRLDTPPTIRSAQQSVESHSKPKKQTVSFNVPPPTPPPIFEWQNAQPAHLGAADFDFQNLDMDRSRAWWEGGGKDRRKSRALPKNYQTPAQKLTGITHHKNFQPKLFLRCGPLLRYTGIKKITADGPQGARVKEVWRGSIMIVSKDSRSSYENPPSLRLFSQPMNLLPPPPAVVSNEDGMQLAPEYIDPTAGLMKVGRDGRPLYVKPIDNIEEQVDLCAVENDDGIYELSPSGIDDSHGGYHQPVPATRIHPVDGETVNLHRDIPGVRLYADAARDVTFWRFNLEVELGATQQRIAYRINQGPALGFWVPAAGQPMNIMFHSGNGFSPSVDSNRFCGPDPLWRDVLNEHQTKPFHVMIGGGDQIFNDSVVTDSRHFQEWINIKNPAERYGMPFTPEFRAELEHFYLQRYASWFSQGLFSLANSQIPMVNMWNDHELFEGYGSYNEDFMQSSVVSGMGKIAHKYYLLFQHHSVVDETEAEEPSWLLGMNPGPYIQQKSRNIFMSLGSDVVLLGLDCRTERTSTQVLSEGTCDMIWDRCHKEIARGETKHLIVLSSVPVAYPRMAMLKNYMNSRNTLGKSGRFGRMVNRAGGSVEVFDDHWAGKHLKSERTWLVEDLQDLAAEKSVRVTILSGDVHLAAIGQFYSNPKLNVAKDKDYRYMPNVISSAIADMPETEIISDMLNKRNTVHHIDSNTDEDIIPIFTQDVDGKSRNNKRLLPRRNWCSIREYRPGLTPPDSPESTPTPQPAPGPRKLQRTLSLGRGDRGNSDESGAELSKPGGLFRRLSGRRPPPSRTMSLGGNAATRRASVDVPTISRPMESGDSYFSGALNEPKPGQYHRRPTNLSDKAAKRAAKHGDDGVGAFVDLEGGLAITLHMEISPQDPAGITTPYKLLVPALRYEGNDNEPPPTQVVKGWRKWLPRRKKAFDSGEPEEEEDDIDDYEDDDDTINNTRANAAATATAQLQQMHYQHQQHHDDYPGSEDSESKLPQRLPSDELGSSPEEEYDDDEEEEPEPRRKKWFGLKP
ncbi:hypothetical protein N7493_004007 [Penicillium malachiteum]|uniref:PhoD-like phosphatase domain-containing protein n=1 Tax=Penicillium malachiteum TaxID=1324776 RepID=A0AAD6HQP9_9EURO|nr:hypothetical protein N7493_004007 [Penicillium malachiteum]